MTNMHPKKGGGAGIFFFKTSSIHMHILGSSNKKPRQPNWEHGEFIVLVKVKHDEHITTLVKIDP